MEIFHDWRGLAMKGADRIVELERKIGDLSRGNFELLRRTTELEAENTRLRKQRDAANAQLDFILENKE